MTKEEINKKSNILLTRMGDMNYSEFIINETSIWISVIKNECLEQYFEHLLCLLDCKPNEESFRDELYRYSETVAIVYTEEERRHKYEAYIRHRKK